MALINLLQLCEPSLGATCSLAVHNTSGAKAELSFQHWESDHARSDVYPVQGNAGASTTLCLFGVCSKKNIFKNVQFCRIKLAVTV